MEEIARSGSRYPQNTRYPDDGRSSRIGHADYPSSRYRTYSNGNLYRISVPDNWREVGSGNDTTFAPEGAYGDYRGQFVFTHGVQIGVSNTGSRNLRQGTDELINSLAQGNPNLRQTGTYRREYIGGRDGLSITLANVSEATGRSEVIRIFTTTLRSGEILYVVTVAPQDEYNLYEPTFQNIVRTIEING